MICCHCGKPIPNNDYAGERLGKTEPEYFCKNCSYGNPAVSSLAIQKKVWKELPTETIKRRKLLDKRLKIILSKRIYCSTPSQQEIEAHWAYRAYCKKYFGEK